MTFEYLGCMGFEMKSQDIFDISKPTGFSSVWTNDTPGSWSRYSVAVHDFSSPGLTGAWSSRELGGITTHGSGIGMWMLSNMKFTGDPDLLYYKDSGGVQHGFIKRNGSTGKLEAYRGSGAGTLLATGDHAVSVNDWHSINVWVLVADSGGRVRVVVDGVIEIDFTGDTQNAGSANIASFALVDQGLSGNQWVDDFIWGLGDEDDCIDTFPKVWGLYPNGDGNQHDLTKTPSSINRFFFPTDDQVTPSPNFANISPAFDSSWEQTTSARRRKLDPTAGRVAASGGGGSGSLQEVYSYSGISAGDDLLWCQYISPPIAAQTISGNVKGQMRVQEASSSDDERAQIVIRVVSNDGSTVRGTLYAGDTGALSSEFGTAGMPNRRFPRGGSTALSSVVAQNGDRIVVEIGCRHHASTTSSGASMRPGEDQANDLPEDETSTAANNPWIEFDTAITMSSSFGNNEYVREGPSDNNSYVSTDVVNDEDLYAFENMGSDAIHGVSVYVRARRSGGAGTIQIGARRNATSNWDTDHGLPTGFGVVARDMPQDPTDSTAWTPTKVNDSEFGVRVT